MSSGAALDRRLGRFAPWAGIYALAIVYVSVVLGPDGVNFVPRDPAAAWRALLTTPYLATGSDQRPDWMANLLMLVPLGFLATGALWPRPGRMPRGRMPHGLAAGAALLGCLLFVVAVKYAQLFFPPRTVSLNYILAQSLGSLLGVTLFCLLRDRLSSLRRGLAGGGRRPLAIACGGYMLVYFLYLLFPFDFALGAEDLRARTAVLPALLLSWPGAGLPASVRLIVAVADIAATIPLGVLLALGRPARSLPRIALAGFLIMAAATATSLLLLDATPSLAATGLRTAGVVLGGALTRSLTGSDLARWRDRAARLVPWLVVPYALAILFVRNLLTPHWRTVPQALAAFDRLGLLPFYHHYIVTKAHAAQSVAIQLVCFAPIGVMIALRRGGGRASVWAAALIALLFALAIEFGRWFKPGLQPDFTNPILAAFAAGLAVRLTAVFWHVLEGRPATAADIAEPARRGGQRARLSQRSAEPAFRESGRTGRAAAFARLAVALVTVSAAGFLASRYPLAPWLFGAALALYAAALWRWPSLWLAVLPAVLPAFDLTPWTGWTLVGEPDLVALVTIGTLVLRAPPRAADFRVRGLAALALGLTILSCLASVALGLAMPGPAGGSDNPYLRPDNALRLAKGLVTALALLPFLRERRRTRGDALAWLGGGMTAGLALVATATIAERALFPGLFDFAADYRVVATFSSMHLGGGHIGAYIAMALPFVLVLMLRPRPFSLALMFAIALGAGYALVVTFARTAYAAAALALVVACLGWAWAGWAWAARHGGAGARPALVPAALVLALVGAIVWAGAGTPLMGERLETTLPDLSAREANWTGGLALRDNSVATALFGAGLGTYPRIVLARRPGGRFPTNFAVAHDGAYRFLALNAGSPTYFGQKITVTPGEVYRLFLSLRSPDGRGRLSVILCEKLLLYSENCRGAEFAPHAAGRWEDFGAALSTTGLGRHSLFGWLGRPTELALVDPVPGTTIEIGHLRMFDPQDHDILANGDFSRGTERWYFTDDDHLVWRIENQYLMTWFEGGLLGLAALIVLAGAALLGAARGIGRGERMAACIAGALVAFLCSGLFDYLLEAPRLATLFYLVAFCGLTMIEPSSRRDAPAGSPRTATG